MNNRVTIVYCRQCGWLLRASWMGQELLSTFGEEIVELSLQPGSGGIFEIAANGTPIWSRNQDRGFPETTALKRRVRDIIAPERDLGCIDRKAARS